MANKIKSKFNPMTGNFDKVSSVTGEELKDSVTNGSGVPISALQAVYYTSPTEVAIADSTVELESRVAGIALNAANPGDSLTILTEGIHTDPFWSWTPQEPIFLGPSGTLTQTAPITGFRIPVGYAIDATSLDINIQESIDLNC